MPTTVRELEPEPLRDTPAEPGRPWLLALTGYPLVILAGSAILGKAAGSRSLLDAVPIVLMCAGVAAALTVREVSARGFEARPRVVCAAASFAAVLGWAALFLLALVVA